MTTLATYTDMIDRYDERTLKDLCSDSGTPVTTLQGDRKLTIALQTASGRLLAACRVCQLYTATDLATMEGADDSLVKSIVCSIAMAILIARRPRPDMAESLARIVSEAEDYLKLLRDGHRVFGLEPQLSASVPDVQAPTVVEVQNLNLITSRAHGYFPNPSRRLPIT